MAWWKNLYDVNALIYLPSYGPVHQSIYGFLPPPPFMGVLLIEYSIVSACRCHNPWVDSDRWNTNTIVLTYGTLCTYFPAKHIDSRIDKFRMMHGIIYSISFSFAKCMSFITWLGSSTRNAALYNFSQACQSRTSLSKNNQQSQLKIWWYYMLLRIRLWRHNATTMVTPYSEHWFPIKFPKMIWIR